MKKIIKTSCTLFATLLILSACSNTVPEGKQIGTIDNNNVFLAYYDAVFAADENKEKDKENPIAEQEKEKDKEKTEDTSFDKTSVVLATILEPLLKNEGKAHIDRQKLNSSLNRLKNQYGDKYIEEAQKQYRMPIETEQDLIRTLSFSLLYTDYLEQKADVTDEKLSALYYDKYKTKYNASHILVEDEKGAKTLLNEITNGKKTFESYMNEAQEISNKESADKPNPQQQQQGLSLKDTKISGVKVKEISDLGTKPASTYVAPFAAALKQMKPGETTTTPVKTEFGYHIIHLTDIEETELTKDVQNEVKSGYIQSKRSEPGFTAHFITNLVKEGTIDITDENVKKTWDEYIKKEEEDAKKYKPETEGNETDEKKDDKKS